MPKCCCSFAVVAQVSECSTPGGMQALFAARAVFDILGRMLPRSQLISTRRGLLGWAVAKAAMTPFFFMYCHSQLPRSDTVAVLFVAAFWLLSGHLNTVRRSSGTQVNFPQSVGSLEWEVCFVLTVPNRVADYPQDGASGPCNLMPAVSQANWATE